MNVDFLNLEYILLRVYNIFVELKGSTGFSVNELPDWLYSFGETILIVGMVSSLTLLLFIVYALIRMVQVEHAGFHEREERERALREQHVVQEEVVDDRFGRIMELGSSSNPSDWRRAILEADIMLSAALAQNGYTGNTIADQLRNANPLQMTTLDLAWKAHKVRNDIAHGGEAFALSERDARATIDLYRRVFEELGAL
jgi:hypothetical protein